MSLLTGLGLGRAVETTVLLNANVATTGAGSDSSAELDITQYEGDILLTVNTRASGTAAMTIAVEESNTTGTGFTAVPAAALVDDLGDADTFDSVSTGAGDQTLVLKSSLLKKFVRVTFSGTDHSHDVAVVAAAQKKYTDR